MNAHKASRSARRTGVKPAHSGAVPPSPAGSASRAATGCAPTPSRILLVDDHPLVREGIAQWIHRAPDLKVCGEAENAADALSMVGKLKPDLVLTDISLPGRNGIELVKDLRTFHPNLPVLVLSMHDESLYAGRALRAGARGYLMKREGGARLVQAIHEVLQGRIVVSSAMATYLLEEYSGGRARAGRSSLPQLSDREFEVFQLLGEARSNREIAEQLHLSPKTVETHRLNLMRKLKVKTAAEAMRLALQYVEKEAAGTAGEL
jgi:DNA-binding NarL/FixJ family response regulator